MLLLSRANLSRRRRLIQAPTLPVANAQNGGSNTGISTSSFTPSAGGLLIAVYRTRDSADATHSMSTSLGVSFTLIQTEMSVFDEGSGNRYYRQSAYWAQVGGSPSAGTVTGTASESVFASNLQVFEIIGAASANPIVQSKKNNATGTSISLTLDSTPINTSMLLSLYVQGGTDPGAFNPITNFTEVEDLAGTSQRYHTCYKIGSGGTTDIAYSGLTTNRAKTLIGVEIRRNNW